jgi:nucleoside-diphosphate-sugar epimerase
MQALVTGGAGFIGHHLVRALLARGDEVVILDDFSTGLRERLDPFLERVRVVEGSILDDVILDQVTAGCEVIFHEAALASVERSFADPVASSEVNISGTIQVVLAAARHGVRRVVFAASSSVYGVPSELPCRETMKPAPQSPYGVSKLAAEYDLHALGAYRGVETVALRYFNVFGPGQDPASHYAAVIPRFVTAVLEGRAPTINGTREITRDFTYVDNVIAANLLAASAAGVSGMTMNVACGDRWSLRQLLQAICSAAGRSVEPDVGPERPGDILHSQADISLARSLLGYRVEVPFQEGISRTVEWYRTRTTGD